MSVLKLTPLYLFHSEPAAGRARWLEPETLLHTKLQRSPACQCQSHEKHQSQSWNAEEPSWRAEAAAGGETEGRDIRRPTCFMVLTFLAFIIDYPTVVDWKCSCVIRICMWIIWQRNWRDWRSRQLCMRLRPSLKQRRHGESKTYSLR